MLGLLRVPGWNQRLDQLVGHRRNFLLGEFEQVGQRRAIGQLGVLVSEFVEEGVREALERLEALLGVVNEDFRD